MSDQEGARKWQSVRTVLEAIIVALLLWSGRSMVTLQTQIAVVQSDISVLRGQLADVPQMSTRLSRLEVQVENDRQRLNELQQLRGLK